MDFIAIDIETANQWRDSICSIGLVKVVDGEIQDTLFTYINPEQPFDEYHTHHHGLTAENVQHAPTFKEFYPTLCQWLNNQFVVAHYVKYDENVIQESCESIQQLPPYCQYGCTLELAQKACPELPNFKLASVASKLSIPLTLENAEIIARIVLELGKTKNITHVKSLFDINMTVIQNAKQTSNEPFFKGKTIVFTGGLHGMTRTTAAQKVRQAGGIFSNVISKQTDYLVISRNSIERSETGHKSSKFQKAEQLISMGHSIQLIHEELFIKKLK
ncbi:DNA polymerase III subunit epsilon [Viridibacillus sp. YIM B01967]|uniref:DNA polymerase III subunit epsilon n=1 Tax=Viridibacillus soli TaxID=2798301 RepID=A0ABS1HBV7_9BACL|nr:exonuclease domain-containing protein [Viridibacillus soli]MBK3496871.1 DNA polymerase III subunit epsilon [Viridibacillus soli]